MSCCLSGTYDATDIFVRHDRHDEQDPPLVHAETLNSLLVIVEPVIKIFDLPRVLHGPCRGGEADAVLHEIVCRFGLVPFILHAHGTTGYRYFASINPRKKGTRLQTRRYETAA